MAAIRKLCLVLAWAAATLAQAAGTLDPTFVNGERTILTALRYPSLAVSPDGRIALAATGWAGSFAQVKYGQVAMFDGNGQPETAFGSAGVARLPLPLGNGNHSADAAAFDSLGRLIVSGTRMTSDPGAFTTRVRSDSQASASYANGAPGLVPPSRLGSAFALAIDRKSRVVIGGGTAFAGGGTLIASPDSQAVIARLAADGANDASFGPNGQVVLASPGIVRALALDSRDGVVFAFGEAALSGAVAETKILMRLRDDGSFDTQFGSGGQTVVPSAIAAAGDAQGRMLVLAQRADATAGRRLLRFVDGRPDATFGTGGEVLLPRAYAALATAADGTVYAGMADAANQTATLYLVRVRKDGTIDTAYGTQGEAVATFDFGVGGGSSVPALAIDGQDRVVVAAIRFNGAQPFGIQGTTVMLYRFTSNASELPPTATAIEYRHAAFDHYFVTADGDEIAKLDADPSSGWLRTGESFVVQVRASGAATPVCRFFSGATFAPLSSHFYTPYPDECDAVDAGPAWKFEKLAFSLTLPTGSGQGNGTCPSGTVPLHRAYNAMKGGAPNHRYTTRAATLDTMIAQGWIMEGEAHTRVFACVPA